MNEKKYMKPAMKVVELQHCSHLLAGSAKARGVSSDDGFYWENTTNGYDR